MTITPPTIADLTGATLDGAGIFDVLMRANKIHLEDQFAKGRIKGPEYATVYLGSLEQVLTNAVHFLLTKDKSALDAQLVEAQIALAGVELEKAQVELEQASVQLEILQQTKLKTEAEIRMLDAQTCKLKAEYDLTLETKNKTVQETQLLTWKVTTEKAQTLGAGVDPDSVIGKQKALYQAQTDGFTRDAEQKVAKIMVDSWNVRRTTDDATVADAVNNLNDVAVGRAVVKLLAGVDA